MLSSLLAFRYSLPLVSPTHRYPHDFSISICQINQHSLHIFFKNPIHISYFSITILSQTLYMIKPVNKIFFINPPFKQPGFPGLLFYSSPIFLPLSSTSSFSQHSQNNISVMAERFSVSISFIIFAISTAIP